MIEIFGWQPLRTRAIVQNPSLDVSFADEAAVGPMTGLLHKLAILKKPDNAMLSVRSTSEQVTGFKRIKTSL